jgi:hypothetical protein
VVSLFTPFLGPLAFRAEKAQPGALEKTILIDFVIWLRDYFRVMLPSLLLIFAAIAYRLAYALSGAQADWANFSPLAAIVLCSAAFFKRKSALLIITLAILGSDLLLNAYYRMPLVDLGMASRYFSFWLVALLGFWVKSKQYYKMFYLLFSTVMGSLMFYVVTNTDAWLTLPGYTRDFPGWLRALTIGEPGYPPTILFLRNTLLSDSLFTGLFILTQTLFAKTTVTLPAKNPAFPLT